MPCPRALRVLVVLVPLTTGLAAGPAAAAWRWPVHARVLGAFAHDARTPFRARQRRGLDLAAAPGLPVRAPCRGRVLFAGPLPRRGLGLTVLCGPLRATLLGLGRLAVVRGAAVRAGAVLGTVGRGSPLRLGARRAGERFGYVDPALLLADDPVGAPRLLPPGGRRRRGSRTPAIVVAPPPPVPAPVRVRAPAGPPALAWAGLLLAATGLPLGVLVRGARRRRAGGSVSGAARRAARWR